MISFRKADLLDRITPKPHIKGNVVKLSELVKGTDNGRRVIYLPQHANGDWYHVDSQTGKISSWNHEFVFVNFGNGDTSPACDPNDLQWMFDYPVKTASISYRKADLIDRLKLNENEKIRQKANEFFTQTSKGHQVYEHNFEEAHVGDDIYSGIIKYVYDARFVAGSRRTLTDPGEPNRYEIAILNVIILPGDIIDENGVKLYDVYTINRLCDDISMMIDDDMIKDDIEQELLEANRDSR